MGIAVMMNGVAHGAETTLLERDEDLTVLSEALARVEATGEGAMVLVGGEAGAGKTSLLRSFCKRQRARVRVLWGACEPLLTPRPLGPIVDVAEILGGELAELLETSARPHQVAAALMRELPRDAATLLVFEDVHWADEATLDVITLLGRRVQSARAVVVLSFRDDELDRARQLRAVLGELGGCPLRMRMELLSPDAVGELARHSPLDARTLYEKTGGNPFFVTEVLAAGGEGVPTTVKDAVLARIARLSSAAQELLEAVAIVPGSAELWLIEAIGAGAIEGLDEAAAAGALIVAPASVSFRHELARLAVEEATSPSRRLALHREALRALTGSARKIDPARIAHHADAAGDADAVLRSAPRAAERAAAAGAHREAAAQYARALSYAEDEPLAVRAELFERRAIECYTTAEFDEAIAAQRAALACQREMGDTLGEGNALRALSRLSFFSGTVDEGEALAREAVELLEHLPPGHELAMAYGNVSQRRMVVHDWSEALVWGARALELASSLEDTEALVYALITVGMTELQRSGARAGHEEIERALALAQQHDLDEYAGRAFNALSMFPVRARNFELARSYIDRGLEYCTDRGLETWRLYLLAVRARIELDQGQWDAAADSAGAVERGARRPWLAYGWALVVIGLLRIRRGDPGGLAPLEQERGMSAVSREIDRIAQVSAALAEAAWLSGESTRVEGLTEDALALALEREEPWAAGELAVGRFRAGARVELPEALATTPFSVSIAGDWSGAGARWRALGCPYESALALLDASEEKPLRQAHEQLQELGAAPAAAIAARKLRELGARGVPRGPRRRTRENPVGLTAREVDVVALLAGGLRNAEIAARLVISERTVDHHVSAILRKLDVRTRGQAAAEAMRLGIVSQR
jgi:DNA-binding CsgD family transcriptional regulator